MNYRTTVPAGTSTSVEAKQEGETFLVTSCLADIFQVSQNKGGFLRNWTLLFSTTT